VINFDDYASIDQAFNTQTTPLTSPIPEPATVVWLMGFCLLSQIRRRTTQLRM